LSYCFFERLNVNVNGGIVGCTTTIPLAELKSHTFHKDQVSYENADFPYGPFRDPLDLALIHIETVCPGNILVEFRGSPQPFRRSVCFD
jgi:hypothetical protein